ncbi:MAG: hypothetical protein OXC82_07675 [Rhodobacteraceae bacterium]|nr:hypothetical protein [Paracoccaceae bacterium]MCY4250294.1 hypothetical protein [Paracoccaceae bacterium]
MTDTTTRNLVTFFSIVFGFYMTSIAIFINASYTKDLHKQIDEKNLKRGSNILKSYLLNGSYCSIISITLIILFTTIADKNTFSILHTKFNPLTFPYIDKELDINLLLSSGLFGIAVLNIFFMILILHEIINVLIREAKK